MDDGLRLEREGRVDSALRLKREGSGDGVRGWMARWLGSGCMIGYSW